MVKKITVSFAIILICTVTFLTGYSFEYPSFADSTIDQWTSVTTNEELAQAFEYYCKSRNLFIDGTVLGSATKFTTQSFDNICNTLGIDMSALQANIKKSTDNNGGLQYLFDTNGITAYNRIFAELLQNHELEVGDTVDDLIVYSGELVEDADGNTALAFILANTGQASTSSTNLYAMGSVYKYTSRQIVSTLGNTENYNPKYLYFTDNNGQKSVPIRRYSNGNAIYINANVSSYTNLGSFIYYNSARNSNNSNLYMGYLTIGKVGDKYYCGIYNPVYIGGTITGSNEQTHTKGYSWYYTTRFYPVDADATDVTFTTNNLTINSNTYTDNRQTVINNEGDVYNYDTDDEPPINPPPSTSTPPTNTGGSDGDISFPNFDFQLPEINWSLGDLSEKFPFSIPFDLIAFFTVLNAEPQAPSIDANIPLGSWYTWHFQADFSQFNNWATIIRNVEFIAFCIGLIYLTIRLVKG